MRRELEKLVRATNELQMVVAGLLEYETHNRVRFRVFLNELHDEDYRNLAALEIAGKLTYLDKRFQWFLATGPSRER